MNDLQPIADIHKREVREVARFLNVPQSIIQRTPQGDVWDGLNDEQMMGASYDDLYYYLNMKKYPLLFSLLKKLDFFISQFDRAYEEFFVSVESIEVLHKKNSHKYKVGMPCHFIDVYERKVKGGWK